MFDQNDLIDYYSLNHRLFIELIETIHSISQVSIELVINWLNSNNLTYTFCTFYYPTINSQFNQLVD